MQARSIRLNQDLRDEFVAAVMDEVMPDAKKPSMEKFQKANAQQVYTVTYGPHLPILKKLPKWMTKKTCCFHVRILNNELAFITAKKVLTFYYNSATDYNRYGMYFDKNSPLPELDNDHPISLALKAYKQSIEDWGTKYRELNKQIRDLSNNCNTTGQLFKTWPKALEFAHIFPEAPVKERTIWKPSMDATELDLGVELSQVDVAPIREN